LGVRFVYVDDRIAKPVSLRRFLPRGQNDILLPYSVDGMAWLKRACVLLRPRLLRQTENFYLHALRAELDAPPGCPVGDGPTPPRFALAAFDIVETPWFMTRFPTTSGIWSARFPPLQTGGRWINVGPLRYPPNVPMSRRFTRSLPATPRRSWSYRRSMVDTPSTISRRINSPYANIVTPVAIEFSAMRRGGVNAADSMPHQTSGGASQCP